MIIATNASYKSFVSDYNFQTSRLQASMKRLSTGQGILVGDASADLGISERFRSQVRNGREASKVIQNAMNFLESTDAWLQEVHNILGRMNELSVAALDGSKSADDLKNLDIEFQQLKLEIGRISESGKYNGLQINGKTAIAVWDAKQKKIAYTQADGSDYRTIDINLRNGNTASNGEIFGFESTSGFVGDFIFTDTGKEMIYIAQDSTPSGMTGTLTARQTIVKLDLETKNVLTVDMTSAASATARTQSRLVMDEHGEIWVSNSQSPSGNYKLARLNYRDMTLDAGGSGDAAKWAGGITIASGFAAFAVHDGYAFFFEEESGSSGVYNLVKQNLYDRNDKSILIDDVASAASIGLDLDETYAISSDGQYLAFKDLNSGNTAIEKLSIINTESGERTDLSVETELTAVVGLGFDANNNLFWTNTGTEGAANAIKKATIAPGSVPTVTSVETIVTGVLGEFGALNSGIATKKGLGLSVGGGSAGINYRFQVGPEQGMNVEFVAADARLTKLGISSSNLLTFERASQAVEKLGVAVAKISEQRAVIGAQVSRLSFTYAANESFVNNLAAAENRIRDVDFASESADMTQAQILSQASSSIIAQARGIRSNVLQFLQ